MRIVIIAAAVLAAAAAYGQSLTLQEAIDHAEEHNGLLEASRIDVLIADSDVRAALSRFWPRITPEYRYVDQRNSSGTSSSDRFHDLGVASSWQINLISVMPQRRWNVAPGETPKTLQMEDVELIRRSVPTVAAVTGEVREGVGIKYGSLNERSQITGGLPEIKQIRNVKLKEGRFFTEQENEELAKGVRSRL